MRRLRMAFPTLLAVAVQGCFLFENPDAGELVVRVLDAREQPLAGVRVVIHVEQAESGVNGRLAADEITGEEGELTFLLEDSNYRVEISEMPEDQLFAETSRLVSVTRDWVETETFQARSEATVTADVRWRDGDWTGGVEGARVDLLDAEGTHIRTLRTGVREDWPAWRVHFFNLPRRAYRVRLSEFPEWVSFETTDFDVDLTHEDHADPRIDFDGSYLAERVAEAWVRVDGSPLEGVDVRFVYAPTGQVRFEGATDGEGLLRWIDADPLGLVVHISGFDPESYAFAETEVELEIEDPPGPYVAVFEGTVAGSGANQPPTAAISSPPDGATFPAGELFELIGQGVDPEDGTLGGGDLSWSSDLDGALGTGAIVPYAPSIGTHVVTLAATDSEGLTGTASISVEVLASSNQPPFVEIGGPSDGTTFTLGASATFTGAAGDPEDGLLTGGALLWHSSLDGQIGTGESVSTTSLHAGAHTITLTGTDSGGAIGSATIGVVVSATGTATVAGRVEVAGGGLATVTVSIAGPTNRTTVTDVYGDYTLGGLAPGAYTLTVSDYPEWATFAEPSVGLALTDGQTVTHTFVGAGG